MAMNGVASSGMKHYGLDYKLNFGVPLQKIKEIAGYYTPGRELANLLWKENVRELKIIATLLFPIEAFDRETAEAWLNGIYNQELREQACMNLFQNLPYAGVLAAEWGNAPAESTRTTGYWLQSRLLITKRAAAGISGDNFSRLFDDTLSGNVSLRNAAILMLKCLSRSSEAEAKRLLDKAIPFQYASDARAKEVFDSLSFEIAYYCHDFNQSD
jgi:hypothetical protein